MNKPVDVVAELRYLAQYARPSVCGSSLHEWADHVERLQAETVQLNRLIEEVFSTLSVPPPDYVRTCRDGFYLSGVNFERLWELGAELQGDPNE